MSFELGEMQQVCGVLDLDGFTIRKTFHAREAAFCSVDKSVHWNIRFTLTESFRNTATYKELQSMDYVTKNVHGLSFLPEKCEKTYPPESLKMFVNDCYKRCKCGVKTAIGYKGGVIEKNIYIKRNGHSMCQHREF